MVSPLALDILEIKKKPVLLMLVSPHRLHSVDRLLALCVFAAVVERLVVGEGTFHRLLIIVCLVFVG